MINIDTKVVNLDINKREVVNTSLFLKQHDNNVLNFEFHVNVGEEEMDYTEINKALMIIYFQDGTHLDPILCIPDSDKIIFLVNNAVLSKVGTVDGFLRLYSSENQIMTTNSFRFTVDKDVFENDSIVEDVSLLNQAMDKFIDFESQENARAIAENVRITSERNRASNNSNWENNHANWGISETLRKLAEEDRELSNSNIASEFNTVKSEHVKMKSKNSEFRLEISSLMLHDYSAKVNSINGLTESISDRILFIVPSNLKYIITDINIISYGDCIGLTGSETSTIEFNHSGTNVSTVVFNDVTAFPSTNGVHELTVSNGEIENTHPLTISITNVDGVVTPEFVIQINYKIKRKPNR